MLLWKLLPSNICHSDPGSPVMPSVQFRFSERKTVVVWADPQGDVSPALFLSEALLITCQSFQTVGVFVRNALEILL